MYSTLKDEKKKELYPVELIVKMLAKNKDKGGLVVWGKDTKGEEICLDLHIGTPIRFLRITTY